MFTNNQPRKEIAVAEAVAAVEAHPMDSAVAEPEDIQIVAMLLVERRDKPAAALRLAREHSGNPAVAAAAAAAVDKQERHTQLEQEQRRMD